MRFEYQQSRFIFNVDELVIQLPDGTTKTFGVAKPEDPQDLHEAGKVGLGEVILNRVMVECEGYHGDPPRGRTMHTAIILQLKEPLDL